MLELTPGTHEPAANELLTADEKGQRIVIKSCWTAVDNF